VVTALKRGTDGRSWLLQLYNPTAAPQRVALRWRPGLRVTLFASASDGRPRAPIPGALALPPYGTAIVAAVRR
jgi:hypothetical protein